MNQLEKAAHQALAALEQADAIYWKSGLADELQELRKTFDALHEALEQAQDAESDMRAALEQKAESQPQGDYPLLPESSRYGDATCDYFGNPCDYTEADMHSFVDADRAARTKQAESAYQRGYMDGMSKGRRDQLEDARECGQEPCFYVYEWDTPQGYTHRSFYSNENWNGANPTRSVACYTSPTQSKPLTNDQIMRAFHDTVGQGTDSIYLFARAIEAAYGME